MEIGDVIIQLMIMERMKNAPRAARQRRFSRAARFARKVRESWVAGSSVHPDGRDGLLERCETAKA